MPHFSDISAFRLSTCDTRLQSIFNEVIKLTDCTILCGHRDKTAQEEAVKSGASKVQFPNSKHNSFPSKAVDVMPYPIDWNDTARVTAFYKIVKAVADKQGIKIRWGADWDMDGTYWERDGWEVDGPHYEVVD